MGVADDRGAIQEGCHAAVHVNGPPDPFWPMEHGLPRSEYAKLGVVPCALVAESNVPLKAPVTLAGLPKAWVQEPVGLGELNAPPEIGDDATMLLKPNPEQPALL
jgi:hypothetical protein